MRPVRFSSIKIVAETGTAPPSALHYGPVWLPPNFFNAAPQLVMSKIGVTNSPQYKQKRPDSF
jgi:hypothetical protein